MGLSLLFICILTWEYGQSVPAVKRSVVDVGVVEEVRLVDGSVPHLGNVQVRVGGDWGFVCDDHFGFEAADLVCRELGYPRAKQYTRAHTIGLSLELWKQRETTFFGRTNCSSTNPTLDALTLDSSTTSQSNTLQQQQPDTSTFPPITDDDADNTNTTTTPNDDIELLSVAQTTTTTTNNNNNNNNMEEVEYSRFSECFVYGDPNCVEMEVAGVVCETEEAPSSCSPDQFQCSPVLDTTDNNNNNVEGGLCIHRSSVCDSEYDCQGVSYDENILMCKDDDQVARLEPPNPDVLPQSSPVSSLLDIPGALVGNLQVKRDGVWGNVCDQGFDVKDVKTLCRVMGQNEGWWMRAIVGAGLGRGTGVIHNDYFTCGGDEGFLSNCFFSFLQTSDSCSHRQDAGVFCYGQGVDVRLDGDDLNLREGEVGGRVEVRVGGQWMAVCDTGFDDYDAKAVCRQLGYNTGGEARSYRGSHFGPSPRHLPLLRLALDCYGSEDNLQDCMVIPLSPVNHTCTRQTTASVVCSNRIGDLDAKIEELLPRDCGHENYRPGITSCWLVGPRYSNEDFLLTTASCFISVRSPDDFLVRVGDYNINYNDTHQDDFHLDKVFKHEHFQEMGPRDNDIALIKIQRKHGRGLSLGDRVMGACLPPLTPPLTTTPMVCPVPLPAGVRLPHPPGSGRIKLREEEWCRERRGKQGEDVEEQTSSLLCDGQDSRDDGPCIGDYGGGLTCTNTPNNNNNNTTRWW
ncbi:hypothetical protein Pmani_037177 [Petrolisthes manimaculis]|uniref:Uncharacterized protein n=1 Tax=Petrolisthes manimaculis TaxID=1843537 RepID=A0AAE1TNJ2_9EUCA|nr:hypothetical protein Pmani_037177 [Petrolisthes manimaculis]